MIYMDLPARLKDFWNAHQAELIMVLVGVALIGGGIFWWKTMSSEETKVEIIKTEAASDSASMLQLDISGEVNKPGVYKLKADARVIDALEIAGGVTDKADKEWMDKFLNRSAKVSDGQKIYIPALKSGGSTQDSVLSAQNNTININTASQGSLEGLPGVGPVTAVKIITGRPYGKIEELIEKKIVSQKVFDEIKEQISVW
jgi:competence protein ComEA